MSTKNFWYDGTTPYPELNLLGKLARIVVLGIRFFIKGDYSRQATALTYYTLFSIVPLAALFFGIAKGFQLENVLKNQLTEYFTGHQETLEWICQFANTTLQQAKGGVVAGVGVAVLFGTVIMLASNIEDTFNIIWGLPKRRNFLHKISDYLAMLVVTPILLIVVSGSTAVTRVLLGDLIEWLPLGWRGSVAYLEMGLKGVPLVIAWLVFGIIYYFVPNTRVRIKSALIAALVAGTAFFILQSSLLYVQIALSKYNTIYGSFAILPLFLVWLQWSWLITLFGAELAFVHQNAATGQFEKESMRLSNRLRHEYLLAVTRVVVRHFNSGNAAISADQLIAALHLTAYQVRQHLNELLDSGVLLETVDRDGEPAYVPALPPGEMTICRVCEMLDTCGENEVEPAAAPMLVGIATQFDRLEQAARENTANRLLKDL